MILTKLSEIPLKILGLCAYIPGTWEYYFMFRWENILTLVAWSYVLQMRLRLPVEGCSTGSQSFVTDQLVQNADSQASVCMNSELVSLSWAPLNSPDVF